MVLVWPHTRPDGGAVSSGCAEAMGVFGGWFVSAERCPAARRSVNVSGFNVAAGHEEKEQKRLYEHLTENGKSTVSFIPRQTLSSCSSAQLWETRLFHVEISAHSIFTFSFLSAAH